MTQALWLALVLALGAMAMSVTALARVRRANRKGEHSEGKLAAATGDLGAEWPVGGLPLGSVVPAPPVRTLAGTAGSLCDPDQATLLVFADRVEPWVNRLGRLTERVQRTSQGSIACRMVLSVPEEARYACLATAPPGLILDPGAAIREAFQIQATPAAVLVSTSGKTATPIALGPEPVRELIDLISLAVRPERDVARQDTFRAFSGADEHGHSVSIEHDGEPLAIVVLGARCRHSARLLPRLREVAASSTLRLAVVVSGGSQVPSGLDVPVIFDTRGRAAVEFGYRGTPAVVLVDARGVVRQVSSGRAACEDVLTEVTAGLASAVGRSLRPTELRG